MPGLDSADLVVAATGRVYTAPVGTAAPADESVALAAAWIDLGYTTEDGVTLTPEWETEEVRAWQARQPIRRIRVSETAGVSFTMMQWNINTVPFGFGGGTITVPTAGKYKFTPSSTGATDERALIVQWQDGTKDYRLVIPKGEVGSLGDVSLNRQGTANLEVQFGVVGTDGSDPWYLLTDDPNFAVGS